ncbi:hypothetical protein [Verminephrobacter eiseniae]|uniref:hypothetical protein n=1 Tax=Verminephrobacter eiseniae TaxID=364317 RepID=UPI00223830FE|nr:hypothetical protein [Verminephrobacter eiseniae]MCW5236044.1 hypothetical protein [Verminephrobacter eiseniae]
MNSAQEKLLFFLGHDLSVILGAQESGIAVNVDDCARCMMGKILEIAENDLPFSHLVENSDIVLHAEGPGALHHLPWLSSFNWLTSVADSNLRKLAATVLDIEGADGKRISRTLDIRLGGMAPGSLWIGFKIVPPKAEQDAALAELLISNITHLPDLCRFIEDEGINSAINESVADPAMRDAGLAHCSDLRQRGKKASTRCKFCLMPIKPPHYPNANVLSCRNSWQNP